VGDHTSLLAFIEKRFLSLDNPDERLHLTNRDRHAGTLEDMFDFEGSPSLNTAVGQAFAAGKRLHASLNGLTGVLETRKDSRDRI